MLGRALNRLAPRLRSTTSAPLRRHFQAPSATTAARPISAAARALKPQRRYATCVAPSARSLSSTAQRGVSAADEKVEELTELYNTARDEFEMAAEETEKQTVYAAADRAAAREELDKLMAAFREAVEGAGGSAVAEEVRRRVGQRVRELESAVKAMEDAAARGD